MMLSVFGARGRFLTPLVLLVAFFSDRKRLLHDMVIGTVIVDSAGLRQLETASPEPVDAAARVHFPTRREHRRATEGVLRRRRPRVGQRAGALVRLRHESREAVRLAIERGEVLHAVSNLSK